MSKRGGARPGAGRKPKPFNPADPFAGSPEKVYIKNQLRWYLDTCEGDTLSKRLENALTELAALKPLGPGRARPRGEAGRFLAEKDPFAAVRRQHLQEVEG